jgi:hypothetical protein
MRCYEPLIVLPSFAARWLVARLSRLQSGRFDIVVKISAKKQRPFGVAAFGTQATGV